MWGILHSAWPPPQLPGMDHILVTKNEQAEKSIACKTGKNG
jgi:hypothetical protein